MGAKNKVIAGDFEGKNVVQSGKGVAIQTGFMKKIDLNEETVKDYEVVGDDKRTSAKSAIGRGAVGSLLLGPIGLIAAASAKKKGIYSVAIQFKDGNKSLLEVDDKIYKSMLKALLKVDQNSELEDNSRSDTESNQQDVAGQIKKLAELRDQGILTEDEFNIKKTELLAKI
ncbi:hypothetical protein GCM10008905_02780 [Clostridium malenominatum]|uniref:SHOCT domain-containing protein n=1 Tax=Clostridium malenominatum TaxID=1539 RepID=A0ABP3TSW9_9CLOT